MRYDKPQGQRLKRVGFTGVTVLRGDCVFWWSYDLRKWVTDAEISRPTKIGISSHAPCRSVRAFRKMLRDNPAIRGKATLVSYYVGYNVHG